jgi:hypothetical protein
VLSCGFASAMISPSYITSTRSEAPDLVQVLGDDEDRRTGVALLHQALVDVVGGAHVDATRGLCRQKDPRPRTKARARG